MSRIYKIGILFTLILWIHFVSAQEIIPLNSTHSFKAVKKPGHTYSWWYVNARNDTTRFSSKENQTEPAIWATEGAYRLFVQATDQNNCRSEIISKPFVVEKTTTINTMIVALPDNGIGFSGITITGNVSTNDFTEPDGDFDLEYSLEGNPVPGLVFSPDGSFSYKSVSGFFGKVIFSYKVCLKNQKSNCATAEVVLRILPNNYTGNIAPVASGDVYLSQINKQVTGNLLYNDIDPDGSRALLQISVTPVTDAAFGKVSIQPDGSFKYTPNSDFAGTDKMMYRICDTGTPSLCDSAWVYFKVNNYSENGTKLIPPGDDVFLSQERVLLDFLKKDPGLAGQGFVFNTIPVTYPNHGFLQINKDGSFKYTAKPDYFGIDYFVYEVCNNDTPQVCRRGTAIILILESGTKLVDIAGRDTTISSCKPFMLGGVLENTPDYQFTWSPAANLDNPNKPRPLFTPGKSTEFFLTIRDKNGLEINDSVFIEVSNLVADAGTDVNMLRNQTTVLSGINSNGTGLNFKWTTSNGKIDSGANSANPIVSGFGTYFLQITDKFGCTATDSVKVQQLAQAPVAIDDYDTTAYATEVVIPVINNDTDPQNALKPSTLTITLPPFNGTAYVNPENYSVHYKPNRDFSGKDNFEYRICNTFDLCDQASVFVMVNDFRFVIPEAFSPNGDNINDYFEIIGIEYFEGNSITIINRWGNKVYEAKNYGIETTPRFWDGTANTGIRVGQDGLVSGTYFYVLDLGNGEKPIAGSIYLDR